MSRTKFNSREEIKGTAEYLLRSEREQERKRVYALNASIAQSEQKRIQNCIQRNEQILLSKFAPPTKTELLRNLAGSSLKVHSPFSHSKTKPSLEVSERFQK